MSEEVVVVGDDRAGAYRRRILQHIHDTHVLMCREKTVGIQSMLFSRKQIAEALGIGKDTAGKQLDDMTTAGLLVRERYLMTSSLTDNRWRWLYHITESGVRELEGVWML